MHGEPGAAGLGHHIDEFEHVFVAVAFVESDAVLEPILGSSKAGLYDYIAEYF